LGVALLRRALKTVFSGLIAEHFLVPLLDYAQAYTFFFAPWGEGVRHDAFGV
jgi:hypothetical protein